MNSHRISPISALARDSPAIYWPILYTADEYSARERERVHSAESCSASMKHSAIPTHARVYTPSSIYIGIVTRVSARLRTYIALGAACVCVCVLILSIDPASCFTAVDVHRQFPRRQLFLLYTACTSVLSAAHALYIFLF